MTKIKELIEDFKLNQEILGREKRYVDLCVFRLYRWEKFTVKVLGVTSGPCVKLSDTIRMILLNGQNSGTTGGHMY
jgi:hypothetical protein